MTSRTNSYRHKITPETRRNKVVYLVWENNGLLHKLCTDAGIAFVASQCGHTRAWLQNILDGRKIIFFHDMKKIAKVLAEAIGKKEPWDTRDLFPEPPNSFGVSVFREVTKHSRACNRSLLPYKLFPTGSTVRITLQEKTS